MKRIDRELRAMVVPDRNFDYWEAFPQTVMAKLRTAPGQQPRRRPAVSPFAWEFVLALACLVASLFICQTRIPRAVSYALLKDKQELRATWEQIPNRMRTFMEDEHGLHRLIQDPQ